MNIAILGNSSSWYVAELFRAATDQEHACWCVDFRGLCAAVLEPVTSVRAETCRLNDMDVVIVRTMPPGSLEQVVYRMDVLQRLEAAGVLVLNPPRAVECAVDKFLTTSRLASAGLPTPRTIVCESSEAALEAFEWLGRDVIVKPLFGSEGRGILRVSDPDLALRVFRTLERTDAVLYLQEFVPHAGFDVRVLVLGGEVLGAIRRRHPTDFRTNVARQASAEPHEGTAEERRLALRSAEAVGAWFAGVDILYDPEGRPLVIEVNAVPGWKAFQRATGLDVAEALINFLKSRRVRTGGATDHPSPS